MLVLSREEDSGWLGTGDDDSSSTAFGLGEEELAKAMAAAGGFGLPKLIAPGSRRKRIGTRPDDHWHKRSPALP